MLHAKSMTELRAIAQALGAKFGFGDDKAKLIAAIEAAQAAKLPAPPPPNPIPFTDELRRVPPARHVTQQRILDELKPLVERGLRVSFPDPESWHFACGKKHDSGHVRMALRQIVACALQVMR